MPSTPFGDRLKREREMRGVSLDEVATATRIAPKYLEALENDQWDQLPGGVFNRGFIKSISRYLGLDEDSLMAEYDLVTQGQKQPGPAPVLPPQFERNWKPFIVACAVLLAILLGGFFLVAHFAPKLLSHLHRSHGAVSAPAAPSTGTGSAYSPGIPAASAAADDPLELKLEAGKPAEVTIVADGQTVFDGHVEPGDSRDFQAHESFQVSASEASALLLELNGETVPPLGTPGEPGSITLTRNDLNNSGGAH
jgi:transcriptional regulator with XRE-family HTH domain